MQTTYNMQILYIYIIHIIYDIYLYIYTYWLAYEHLLCHLTWSLGFFFVSFFSEVKQMKSKDFGSWGSEPHVSLFPARKGCIFL